MGYDFHYLKRTVDITRNLSVPAVERAQVLYKDPELLRFVFEQIRLPEGLEDIAIGLTYDELPPHQIVHRSGHFRTILAAGMPVHDAYILTRRQFDGLTERMTDLRERLAAAEKLAGDKGSAGQLVTQLMKAGCYLSREEFLAFSRWQPLLRDFLVHAFGEMVCDLERRRCIFRRYHPKRLEQRVEPLLRDYWDDYFLLGHLALLAVMDRHHHKQPLPVDTERLFDYFPGQLFRLGTIGAAVKSGWVAGELGKDIQGKAKQLYATPDGVWELIEGATALLGIAARRPKTYAEIMKFLDAPLRRVSAEYQPQIETALASLRQVFSALEQPSPEEEQIWAWASQKAFLRLLRLQVFEPMPVELGAAAAAHSQLSLRDTEGIGLLLFALPRAARVEPKFLYFPEDYLSRMRRDWQPSDTLSLLATQESLIGKPQPARAAPQPGRNDPCPCGSGKKYKKCCGVGTQES